MKPRRLRSANSSAAGRRGPALSRRQALAAAAAAAGPTILPSGILAMPGRPGPNDRIVYAHIGVGGMGQSHVVADAAALCDVDSHQLAAVAGRVQGKPMLVKDYREILDRKDIDAVTIGTPDHWHAIMMVHACQAGKDVYSEKPTCRTIQEGEAMVNAARHYGSVVQIGAQGRSNPVQRAAAQYIRNGQIGRVDHVDVWHPVNFTTGWGGETPPPDYLDWDLWLGPARWRPYNTAYCPFNFRWLMDIGGGFIRDRGNHVLSIVLWAMGADNQSPVSVEAYGEPSHASVWDVPVTLNVRWEFKDPDWTLTWGQPGTPYHVPGDGTDWGAKYFGSRDTLVVTGGDASGATEQKALVYTPPPGGVHLFLDPANADPTERHRENWRKCIRTRQTPAMPVDVGVNVVTLAIIGNISYRLGRKLYWDGPARRFRADEEANRLLAQPYRCPWEL